MTTTSQSKKTKFNSKLFSNKEYLHINGVKQGIIIETIDFKLPVLLIIHGGPGYPLFPIIKSKNIELHKLFTVCYWDQRGTGMSYVSDGASLTIEQVVNDTVEVSKYLIKKLNRDKIYLLGHSWGTIVGSLVASKHSDLFHSYIGVGQIGVPEKSEKETYEFLLNKAKHSGNKKWIAEIEEFQFNNEYYKSQKYNTIRSKYTEKFGVGFLRDGYTNINSLKDILISPKYTFLEKINVFKGIFNSYEALGESIASTNLIKDIHFFEIPVFIFQGKHDYLTSYSQAFSFYEHINAPYKAFLSFENSSHSPFIDEPKKFINEIRRLVFKK